MKIKPPNFLQRRPTLWYEAKALFDTAVLVFAALVATELRFEANVPSSTSDDLWRFLAFTAVVAFVLIRLLGVNTQSWHRPSVVDIRVVALAVTVLAAVQLTAVILSGGWLAVPRSVPLIAAAIGFCALIGVRALLSQIVQNDPHADEHDELVDQQRVLIVGAGEAGELVIKEMVRHPHLGLTPVGVIDDDPTKSRLRLWGVPVVGPIADIARQIDALVVDTVLIAVPSADGQFVRKVIEQIGKANRRVKYRTLPGVFELLSGAVSVSRVREVQVDDLLRRPPIKLNLKSIADYVNGETVLITGAGGSIGSELARQLCTFSVAKLVLLGRGENSVYEIERELRSTFPATEIETVIANVSNYRRMSTIFERYQPGVVFHAAAHKHVPFMERHPEEAIINNVVGTRVVASLALANGVKRFVNVSTDKAVNPSSIMGASKRLAECVVSELAKKADAEQRFVTVRFGNVLGSRGSVVPLFVDQIKKNKPITVTHPEMTRYFMTIPEAVQLVLQAGGLAQNGGIYILDMGDPVKIVDLAEDIIRLSGFEPHIDVPILFTGTRPGEKIHEELMSETEKAGSTAHEQIFFAANVGYDGDSFERVLTDLEEAARGGHRDYLARRLIAFTNETIEA